MCLSMLCCACGTGDKVVNSNISSVTENSGVYSTTSSQVEVKTDADAVLTIKVKNNEVVAFKSNRPYDANKEDISLILVVGQSNFTTGVGYPSEYSGFLKGTVKKEPEEPTYTKKGTVYSSGVRTPITALTADRDLYNLCDTSNNTNTLGGVSASFGAKWNELTNTKVVLVQAAVGAVGVHEWTPDPQNYECSCSHNGQNSLYSTAVSCYKQSYEALSKKYNIVYAGYIWNQGEHDEVYSVKENVTVNSDKAYYDAYKSMHDGFMSELKLDFGGISVVRADKAGSSSQGSMSLTVARNAQYKLCNDIDNLYMISTVSETCDTSIMDQVNTIHYSQYVFNIMGDDCAQNLYYSLGLSSEERAFSGLEVYAKNGVKLIAFDKDGSPQYLNTKNKDVITNHILARVSSLGTASTISGYTITSADGTDLSMYINEFGAIDWSGLNNIEKIEIRCVVE